MRVLLLILFFLRVYLLPQEEQNRRLRGKTRELTQLSSYYVPGVV